MNETCLIVLPLPSGLLSPNRPCGSRGSRMARYRVSAHARLLAKNAAIDAQVESGPWGRATVSAVFFHKIERRRDDINHMAMLKPYYDGIVESGLLEDDDSKHLTTLPAKFEIDKKFPRVELTFTRME